MMIELILQNAPFERSIFVGNATKTGAQHKEQRSPTCTPNGAQNLKVLKENEFNTALELWGLINRFLH
ncbi:Uncharacterised protein [Helicobacter fennelliae]|uniref:Uncharacterized protein n=1 Tax=Helicobacter fennelliae TaxID=215 RepID=A0A2X3EI75_9HELI|nr:hypothetical protein [Helicobacter fennelliae]SQC36211.1 Uncharacterised protein [Helicobacter fennelliae]